MKLDIVIPVYNEGQAIVPVLEKLISSVKTPYKIFICYDFEADTTLPHLKSFIDRGVPIIPLKNRGKGAHGAILTGFKESTAGHVLVFPADDLMNAGIIDRMMECARNGARIVCASRFMKGGSMEGCPWLKAVMVRTANFTLWLLARLPTHDSTNGFRLFSRQVIDTIPIQSNMGFTYSLELLVKTDRLGWRVDEVPARWVERSQGKSRFQVIRWVPAYLRWYFYGFLNIFLRKNRDQS